MSAVRDLRSNVACDLALYAALNSSGSSTGYILDTADYDSGIMFSFAAPVHTGGTGFLSELWHSDSSSMTGQVDVPDENIIGSKSDISFSAATSQGGSLPTLGIVGTKRYVQFEFEWTGGAGGQIVAVTSKVPEILKVT